MKKEIIQNIKLIALTLVLATGVSYVSAQSTWTNPPGSPPNCPDGTRGCDAPLNVGSSGQTKSGGLPLNTGGATNGLIVKNTDVNNGKVGIGVDDPINRLDVNGDVGIKAGWHLRLYSSNNNDYASMNLETYNSIPNVVNLNYPFAATKVFNAVYAP